jgi:RNA polymerase sigma-70 factor (ECF subfamily)
VAAGVRHGLELVVLAARPRDATTPPAREHAPDRIDACRRGDRDALEEVFRAHAVDLERLLVRVVGPGHAVEDLLQETFAAAVTAFPRFRGEASVRTWLRRIAVHVADHHLRQPRHRRDVALDEVPVPATSADSPQRALENAEVAERLYAHLDTLDSAKRIALVLHVIEELPVAEVAALVGASRAATKTRIFLARRALRRRLERDPVLSDHGDRT